MFLISIIFNLGELQAMIVASPSDSVYRGTTNATIYCCVNVDPRDFIPMSGVSLI